MSSFSGLPPKKPGPKAPPEPSLTSSGGSASGRLPPKPLVRRQSTPIAHLRPSTPTNVSGGNNKNNNIMVQRRPSASSVLDSPNRQALQKDVEKRTAQLTASEVNFLQQLLVHGSDHEVEIAHENLLDENLFDTTLRDEDEKMAQAWINNGPDNNNNPDGSIASSLKSSTSTNTLNPLLQHPFPGPGNELSVSSATAPTSTEFRVLRTAGSATDSVGSERRQEKLQQRREQNAVFDQIWKAHENGLAVTRYASRKRISHMSKSMPGMSPAIRHSAIFRRRADAVRRCSGGGGGRRAGGAAVTTSMNDNKSDNMRRRLVTMDGNHNNNKDSVPDLPPALRGMASVKKSPLRRLSSDTGAFANGKPFLRRMLSDGSRKSVTFELPIRENSARSSSGDFQRRRSGETFPSIPSLHHGHPIRSSSFSSVPSLHRAHALRSNSVASSVGTYPALPHFRNMRSNSFGSSASAAGLLPSSSTFFKNPVGSVLYIDYEGRDPSEAEASAREEKKTDPLFPGVPTNLEFRQTDDSSKYLAESHPPPMPGVAGPERVETASSAYFVDVSGDFSIEDGDDDEKSEKKQTMVLYKDSSSKEEEYNRFGRPVMMRDVSGNGEGVEIADLAEAVVTATPAHMSPFSKAGGEFDFESEELVIHMANSFDETMSFNRMSNIFRRSIKRSLSDEAAAGLFVGPVSFLRDSVNTSTNKERAPEDGDSWQMDEEEEMDYYDPWMVIEDEYENGYGGGGTLPFQIIGTSASDKSAKPHVLSPPLMESLQQFLPFALTGENFWLKYSLVRDGASMRTFLKHARNAKSSILAVETVDGEVFGAFTSECWRKNWNYFGTGEAFLWRMRQSRGEKARSIIDQAHRESELDVYPFTGENNSVQLCTDSILAVGGGAGDVPGDELQNGDSLQESEHSEVSIKNYEWGHGLALQKDLLQGTSSPCLTFGSPSLSKYHADGSLFEVINLELWAMTPCYNLEEAEKLELGKLFLEKYSKN